MIGNFGRLRKIKKRRRNIKTVFKKFDKNYVTVSVIFESSVIIKDEF